MADWSQLLSAGAIGATAAWLGGIAKTSFEHILDGRKKRAEERRTIRAEEREFSRREAERKRLEIEDLEKHDAVLLMYKTQLNGTADLPSAGVIVGGIHNFFVQRPQFLNVVNRAFLESVRLTSTIKSVLRPIASRHNR